MTYINLIKLQPKSDKSNICPLNPIVLTVSEVERGMVHANEVIVAVSSRK